jgi:hypothetical protein
MPKLTFEEMAQGLERFKDRYHALDVFADDVQELVEWNDSNRAPTGLVPVMGHKNSFYLKQNNQNYRLELFDDEGVARFSRWKERIPTTGQVAAGALVGAAIGAAVTKKGDGWLPGLFLGVLLGSAINAQDPSSPKRVFSLRFDPQTRRWTVYDGGLVQWLKSSLVAEAR